jgi:hypothetical protein
MDDLLTVQISQDCRELERQGEEGLEVEPAHREQRLQRRPTPIFEHQATPAIVAQKFMDTDHSRQQTPLEELVFVLEQPHCYGRCRIASRRFEEHGTAVLPAAAAI